MIQTVKTKAKIVCHKLGLPDDGQEFSIIKFALKEQDRDTRHACAEAVIGANDPHGACMNTKAV